MEQPHDAAPLELVVGLREEVAEIRAGVGHLRGEVVELRQEVRGDIRRLDDRVFQVMLLQLGTLATALASLMTALITALG